MTVEEDLSDDEDGVPYCVSDSWSESKNDSDYIFASTSVTRRQGWGRTTKTPDKGDPLSKRGPITGQIPELSGRFLLLTTGQ